MTTVNPSYAQDFVLKVSQNVPIEEALKTSLENETNLRRIFATDPTNPVLNDPNIGLIDIYGSHESIKRIQSRTIKDPADRDAKYIFPLDDTKRFKNGDPAIMQDMDQFRNSWNIFT